MCPIAFLGNNTLLSASSRGFQGTFRYMVRLLIARMLDRMVRTGFLRSFLACLNSNASISDCISRECPYVWLVVSPSTRYLAETPFLRQCKIVWDHWLGASLGKKHLSSVVISHPSATAQSTSIIWKVTRISDQEKYLRGGNGGSMKLP